MHKKTVITVSVLIFLGYNLILGFYEVPTAKYDGVVSQLNEANSEINRLKMIIDSLRHPISNVVSATEKRSEGLKSSPLSEENSASEQHDDGIVKEEAALVKAAENYAASPKYYAASPKYQKLKTRIIKYLNGGGNNHPEFAYFVSPDEAGKAQQGTSAITKDELLNLMNNARVAPNKSMDYAHYEGLVETFQDTYSGKRFGDYYVTTPNKNGSYTVTIKPGIY